jgi:phospholipid/cholesterol/gamma-HCH transport system permease protein
MKGMQEVFNKIGYSLSLRVVWLGKFLQFFSRFFTQCTKRPYRIRNFVRQMEVVGQQSLLIILLSAVAIGGAFALQVAGVFSVFKAETLVGGISSLSFARELASIITGSLLAGRAGSAMTAEIATMRIHEQLDAMEAMGVNPIQYLVVPRVVAATVMSPLLTGFFIMASTLGSFLVATYVFGIDPGVYQANIFTMTQVSDVMQGLQKGTAFGLSYSTICCWYGLNCTGGAKGVGRATTNAVIASLLAMLFVDFFITYLQLG